MLHFQAHERLPMNQNNASENIDFEKKKKNFLQKSIKRLIILIFTSIFRYLLGLAGNMILFSLKLLSHFANAFKYRINSRHFAGASFRLFHSWTARFLKGQVSEKCCTDRARQTFAMPLNSFAARQRVIAKYHALISFSNFL